MTELICLNGKGQYHDQNARADTIRYIMNFKKMPNHHYYGHGVDLFNAAESMNEVAQKFGKTTGVQLRHYILSFDPAEVRDPCFVFCIACKISEYFAQQYQVIFAVHENTPNLHVHFVVNSVSYVDGRKYHGSKADHYHLMQYIRRVLKYFGLREFAYTNKLTEDFDI